MTRMYRSLPYLGNPSLKKKPQILTGVVSPPTSVIAMDTYSRLRGYQMKDSIPHPGFTLNKSYHGVDNGGPWETLKFFGSNYSHARVSGTYKSSTQSGVFRNCTLSPISPVGAPNVDSDPKGAANGTTPFWSSDSVLRTLGTTAIARVSPVNPNVPILQSITEIIRDGLPTLTGLGFAKQRSLSSVGDEYLNFQFGIKPLLNDVKGVVDSVKNHERILNQLERDSGKLVKRRYHWPDDITVTSQTRGGAQLYTNAPIQAFPVNGMTGILTTVTTKTIRRSFSGAFTYYLPGASSPIVDSVLKAEKLFGAIPDVSDLWNVLPFSWLADWKFNTGDVLQNLTNASIYGQVLPYAYMMEESIMEYEYTLEGIRFWDGRPCGAITAKRTYVHQRRIPATPYGFGQTWGNFNNYQLSILAALGISRL